MENASELHAEVDTNKSKTVASKLVVSLVLNSAMEDADQSHALKISHSETESAQRLLADLIKPWLMTSALSQAASQASN